MNKYCDVCDSVLVYRTQPGMLDKLTCPACIKAVVQLPPVSRSAAQKADRKAGVLEHYDEMPLPGRYDGDTYYIKSMNAICRWDAEKQDYQILPVDAFYLPNPEDKQNNRRAAIMEQRARKNKADVNT